MKAPGEEIYPTANRRKEHNAEKYTFSELQRCRGQYGSIFIRLAVVAP